MSLVNDMLNDLEQRRSKPPAESSSQLQWLTGRRGSTKNRWPLRLTLCISLVLVLAALAWLATIYRPDEGLAKAQAIIDDAAANTAAEKKSGAVATVAAKPKLELIRAQKNGAQIKLLLQLDRVPSYQVHNNGDSLVIHLRDVQAHLPKQLGDLIQPVESINVRRSGADLLIHVALSAPVELQSALKLQPQVQLEVDLRVAAAVLAEAAEPNPAASPALNGASNQQNNAAFETAQKTPAAKPIAKSIPTLKTRLPLTLQQQDKRAAKEARNRLQLGQPKVAEQLLMALLSTYPSAPESSQLLLALLLDQQRLAEAEQHLQALANNKQLSLPLLQLKARLFLLQGNTASAVRLLQSQQPMIQVNPEYYELLALASQRDKQYRLSEQVYKALLNIDSGKGDWWAGLAIAQELQGQKADARHHYRQAMQANRTSDALRQYAQQRYQALAGMTNRVDTKKTVEN